MINKNLERDFKENRFLIIDPRFFYDTHLTELILTANLNKITEFIMCLINADRSGSGTHWFIGLIIVKSQEIIILDSLFYKRTKKYYDFHFRQLARNLYIFKKIRDEQFEVNQIRYFICKDSIQQQNGYECGPIVCYYLYIFISLKRSKTFNYQFKREISSSLSSLFELRYYNVYTKNGSFISKRNKDIKLFLSKELKESIHVSAGEITLDNIFCSLLLQ